MASASTAPLSDAVIDPVAGFMANERDDFFVSRGGASKRHAKRKTDISPSDPQIDRIGDDGSSPCARLAKKANSARAELDDCFTCLMKGIKKAVRCGAEGVTMENVTVRPLLVDRLVESLRRHGLFVTYERSNTGLRSLFLRWQDGNNPIAPRYYCHY